MEANCVTKRKRISERTIVRSQEEERRRKKEKKEEKRPKMRKL